MAVVTAGLGLAAFVLIRGFIRPFLALARVSPGAWNWWDILGTVCLGMVWLILVYLAAYWYQKAVKRGRLWRTFGLVTLAQVAAPVLVVGLFLLIVRLVPGP
jgi:arginine exporter protein ArgO